MNSVHLEENNRVIVGDEDGGFIISQTVEAHLLYKILDMLDDIHTELVNIESGVNPA